MALREVIDGCISIHFMNNKIGSKNYDPSIHYSMAEIEQMLDGDSFEGIRLNGIPLDDYDVYTFNKNDLWIYNPDFAVYTNTIKCD